MYIDIFRKALEKVEKTTSNKKAPKHSTARNHSMLTIIGQGLKEIDDLFKRIKNIHDLKFYYPGKKNEPIEIKDRFVSGIYHIAKKTDTEFIICLKNKVQLIITDECNNMVISFPLYFMEDIHKQKKGELLNTGWIYFDRGVYGRVFQLHAVMPPEPLIHKVEEIEKSKIGTIMFTRKIKFIFVVHLKLKDPPKPKDKIKIFSGIPEEIIREYGINYMKTK